MLKAALFFLFLFPILIYSRDVILSQHLTPEILKGTKISQRKTEGGTIIVITAKNPRIVERIKRIMAKGLRFQYNHSLKTNQILELLKVKQIRKSLIMLNNGVQLNLSTRESFWLKEIRKLDILQKRKNNMP
jgi:hypothetical protein